MLEVLLIPGLTWILNPTMFTGIQTHVLSSPLLTYVIIKSTIKILGNLSIPVKLNTSKRKEGTSQYSDPGFIRVRFLRTVSDKVDNIIYSLTRKKIKVWLLVRKRYP